MTKLRESVGKGMSIHPQPRNARAVARRKKNHARNKTIRADLNRGNRSADWQKDVSTFHDTLKAISMGTI